MPNPHESQLRKTLNEKILKLAKPVGKGVIKGKKIKKAKPPGREKFALPTALSAIPEPSGFLMQPVIPNIKWDWRQPGPGKISQAQFEFCDHMPASSDPDANFSASGNSFSQNYTSFLEIISPDFVPQTLLKTAKASAARPAIPPGDVTGPLGWVLVQNSAGVNRWQPNWIVSSTPLEFMAQAQTETGLGSLNLADPVVLKTAIREGLNLLCYGKSEGQLTAPQVKPGDIQDIQITAGSWGRVSIFPSDWYTSGLMILAGQGPFVGNYSPQIIFGPNGLLPCRISEMIVASGLKARITFSQDFISRNQNNILAAGRLELLGFNFETAKNSQNPHPLNLSIQGTTAILNVSSSSKTPTIIGVVIENFGPSENS